MAKTLGTLVDMPNYGAGDLLEIERPGQRETLLIPYAESYVLAEDLENGIITVDFPMAISMMQNRRTKNETADRLRCALCGLLVHRKPSPAPRPMHCAVILKREPCCQGVERTRAGGRQGRC